jgi:hypothetical protein
MVGKASAQECSAQMAFVGGKFEAARQFNKEASQTRDCCGANNAPHRAARLDSSRRKVRWLGMTSKTDPLSRKSGFEVSFVMDLR